MSNLRLSLNAVAVTLVIAVAAWGTEVSAAESEQTPPTATTVKSDRMTVRNKENQAVFEGKVVLTKGQLVVRSDKMVVYFESREEGVAAQTPGADSSDDQAQGNNLDIKRIEATGKRVHIERGEGRATCRKAVFYQDEQKIVLTGDPVAWQKGNRVAGDKITMFLDQDLTIVEGGSHLVMEDNEGSE